MLRVLLLIGLATSLSAQVRLAIKGDDMGAAHSFNVGTVEAFQKGVVRNTDVIVPGPWFLEAAQLAKEHPGLDFGVHLTLTSEWQNYKWRPLTWSPSLVDEDGYFYPFVFPNKAYPEDRALLKHTIKLEEVEKELRAQIEMAKRHIPRISFLSAHMGAVFATPELREMAEKLAKEYGLPFYNQIRGVKSLRAPYQGTDSAEVKAQKLADMFAALEPGDYALIDHAALDDPEARAIFHLGYERVAQDRSDNVKAWSHPRVQQVVKDKGIQLVTFAALIKARH